MSPDAKCRYRRVAPKLWIDEKLRLCSEDGRMLFLYLLTSPHGNMCGFYRLPTPYACDDLQWSAERYGKALGELCEKGFINHDPEASVVLVNKFLDYNRIENMNQAKGAVKILAELPENRLWPAFMQAVERYAEPFAEPFRNRFGTLAERYTKPGTGTGTGTGAAAVPPAAAAEKASPVDNLEAVRDRRKPVVDAYFQAFGMFPSEVVRADLFEWEDKLGLELVNEAMQRAARANARTFSYCLPILSDWERHGVRTLDDVEKLDQEHKARTAKIRGDPAPGAVPAETRRAIVYTPEQLAELERLRQEVAGST